MTYKDRLEARKLQKRQVEAKARLEARALHAQIVKEDARLAKQRQAQIGQCADAAGLTAVSLDVFAAVFACVALQGTTDAALRLWCKEAEARGDGEKV